MPSVCFSIDGGEPCGSLEEMGCEEFTSAQEIIDALKESARGRGVAHALSEWSLLDGISVTVTYTPDIPEDVQLSASVRTDNDNKVATAYDSGKVRGLMSWLRENETTATWSDWKEDDEPS